MASWHLTNHWHLGRIQSQSKPFVSFFQPKSRGADQKVPQTHNFVAPRFGLLRPSGRCQKNLPSQPIPGWKKPHLNAVASLRDPWIPQKTTTFSKFLFLVGHVAWPTWGAETICSDSASYLDPARTKITLEETHGRTYSNPPC